MESVAGVVGMNGELMTTGSATIESTMSQPTLPPVVGPGPMIVSEPMVSLMSITEWGVRCPRTVV